MYQLEMIFLTAIITAGIYFLFELFARRKERILMVEKMSNFTAMGDAQVPNFNFSFSNRFTALRVGLGFMGVGSGLLFGAIHNSHLGGDVTPEGAAIIGASILLFGGLGLVLSFLIEYFMTRCERNK